MADAFATTTLAATKKADIPSPKATSSLPKAATTKTAASAVSTTVTAPAADMLEVYQQAWKSDPTFRAANATLLSKRENIPIARASLLPTLSGTGSINRINYNSETGTGSTSKNIYPNSNTGYGLSLTQPIFNFAYWATLSSAKAGVKQAEAEFFSAAQDLMYRTAAAYLAVLQAQDVLRFTSEQKRAVGEHRRQQKQRYEVGLAPITDLSEAQASYDSTVAQEIAAQNDLRVQEEKLQEITGIKFPELKKFNTEVPLVKPDPEDIERWVKTAEQQNYSLLAARYATLAMRETVMTQAAGHFPILNAVGSYNYNYDNNANNLRILTRQKTTSGGLSLTVPIFSGGAISARTEQAGYNYQQAVATQEKTHRTVVSGTRQAYLGVVSGISKIKADRQAVISKRSSLQSTQNSYQAGLRTILDVLQAETELYSAEKDYAKDQYAYLLSTLSLKQQSGTLSIADLAKINQWLKHAAVGIDATKEANNKNKAQESSDVDDDADTEITATNSEQAPTKVKPQTNNNKHNNKQKKNKGKTRKEGKEKAKSVIVKDKQKKKLQSSLQQNNPQNSSQQMPQQIPQQNKLSETPQNQQLNSNTAAVQQTQQPAQNNTSVQNNALTQSNVTMPNNPSTQNNHTSLPSNFPNNSSNQTVNQSSSVL